MSDDTNQVGRARKELDGHWAKLSSPFLSREETTTVALGLYELARQLLEELEELERQTEAGQP